MTNIFHNLITAFQIYNFTPKSTVLSLIIRTPKLIHTR
jgi:hypothetical protein